MTADRHALDAEAAIAAAGRSDFVALLADVKGRIQAVQTRAVLAVNRELVRLYWDIGQIIDGRQRREGWGAAVIPRLSKELQNELPELKGFSERNIDRMIAFYRSYPDPVGFSPPAVAKLPPQEEVPPAVAKSSTRFVHAVRAQPPESLLCPRSASRRPCPRPARQGGLQLRRPAPRAAVGVTSKLT